MLMWDRSAVAKLASLPGDGDLLYSIVLWKDPPRTDACDNPIASHVYISLVQFCWSLNSVSWRSIALSQERRTELNVFGTI